MRVMRVGAAVGLTVLCACGGEGTRRDTGPLEDGAVDDGLLDADVRTDAARRDAGIDAAADVPPRPPRCDVGEACISTRGCPESPRCLDPMMDAVGCGTATEWANGYCTRIGVEGDDGCTLGDDTTCCADGSARCVYAFEQMGRQYTWCVAGCEPAVGTNPCRSGYTCDRSVRGCVPGCASDAECMTGALGTCDPTSRRFCDEATGQCTHAGTPGVPAGAPCTRDEECEAGGDCITEAGTEGGWPGGYCMKFGCDVAGVTCAEGGHCQERRFGISACLGDCHVGDHVGGDPFSPHAQCRPGYMCAWDGVGDATATVNGACLPGAYNAVRAPNVGAPCDYEDVCYSPFGAGLCFNLGVWEPAGYCTIGDCAAPGMPADVCGAGATCVEIDRETSYALCLARCATAADCSPRYACTIPDGTVDRVCFPVCGADADCRPGERCAAVPGETGGSCEPT